MTGRLLIASGVLATHSVPIGAQGTPDWSRAPEVKAARAFVTPLVELVRLSNGLQVAFVARHDLPLANVLLVSRSGASEDPAGKFGLANITTALMDAAIDGQPPVAKIAAEQIGASLVAGSDRQSIRVSVQVSSDKLDSALALVSAFALHPTFRDSSLAMIKARRLTSLGRIGNDAGNVAAIALSRAIYGADDADGQSSIGSVAGVSSIELADVADFHARAFQPDRCALIIVGDASFDRLRPALERSFGAVWQSSKAPIQGAHPAHRAHADPGDRAILVDRPKAAQSALRVVAALPPRASPDYYALEVANMVLGGSTTSRIGKDLHDAHGFAYEAKSSLEWRRSTSLYIAYANVGTAVTDSAVTNMIADITGGSAGVTAAELAAAKQLVLRTRQDAFDTQSGVATALADLSATGAALDNYSRFAAAVERVTADGVSSVVRKYLGPSALRAVIVGDTARVAGPLRARLRDLRVLPATAVVPPR